MFPSLWHRSQKECLEVWYSLIDLFYPPVCEVCGDSLVKSEKYLCTACLADFPFTDEDYTTSENVLDKFEEANRPVKLHSLFYYNKYSNYKNLIYLIKYQSYRKLGVYLGHMLGEKIASQCEADCIVPVPLHKKREKERGFNQAFEIARGVKEVLGIEILNDVIFRIQNNVSQTGKNAAERFKNVENIFELRNPQQVEGHHILLLDDVITTGATIHSCLKVLAQVRNVVFSLGCLAQTV